MGWDTLQLFYCSIYVYFRWCRGVNWDKIKILTAFLAAQWKHGQTLSQSEGMNSQQAGGRGLILDKILMTVCCRDTSSPMTPVYSTQVLIIQLMIFVLWKQQLFAFVASHCTQTKTISPVIKYSATCPGKRAVSSGPLNSRAELTSREYSWFSTGMHPPTVSIRRIKERVVCRAGEIHSFSFTSAKQKTLILYLLMYWRKISQLSHAVFPENFLLNLWKDSMKKKKERKKKH